MYINIHVYTGFCKIFVLEHVENGLCCIGLSYNMEVFFSIFNAEILHTVIEIICHRMAYQYVHSLHLCAMIERLLYMYITCYKMACSLHYVYNMPQDYAML